MTRHDPPSPDVLFIVGTTRSGSTLLDMMLGAHPAMLSLGEVDAIRAWYLRDEICTCALRLGECPMWGPVLRLHGSPPEARLPVPLRVASKGRKAVEYLAALMSRRSLASEDGEADRAWALLDDVARLSGRTTLVDSSKAPLRVVRLARRRPERVRLLHIVRDVRGYVASQTTGKTEATPVGPKEFPPSMSKPRALANWVKTNLLAEALGSSLFRGRYHVLSYEDLASRPGPTLAAACAFLGVPFDRAMLEPIDSSRYHSIAGNPARFAGFRRIVLDERWRTRLGPTEQRAIWLGAGWLYEHLRRRALRNAGLTSSA